VRFNLSYGKLPLDRHLCRNVSYSEWSETRRCCIAITVTIALEYAISSFKQTRRDLNWLGHISYCSTLMGGNVHTMMKIT